MKDNGKITKSYGKGEYNFIISDEYEREWKDHKIHVKGKCIYGNGNKYE